MILTEFSFFNIIRDTVGIFIRSTLRLVNTIVFIIINTVIVTIITIFTFFNAVRVSITIRIYINFIHDTVLIMIFMIITTSQRELHSDCSY